MQISLIAAMNQQRIIGSHNQLPWHLPADLKHFKALTIGKPIIMGRKTYYSIGKPLPGRDNVVLSSDLNLTIPNVHVLHSIDNILESYAQHPEIMVIGGGTLYKQFLPLANHMYLTLVDCDCSGDVFFPDWDQRHWQETTRESHQADNNNPYNYHFITLTRTVFE